MDDDSALVPVQTHPWEKRLRQITLVIARLGLAYLFFSQLFWKLPPRFGCGPGPGFTFTHVGRDGELVRGSGICDWTGIQAVFDDPGRRFLVTWDQDGNSLLSIRLGPLVTLNGQFVERVVQPNMGLFGWAVFFGEAFVALSMFMGLFSRAGALVSLLLSIQLMLGLGGVWDPVAGINEWEWSYHLMILLSVVLLGSPSGRILGIDKWLRPRLARAAAEGKRVARLLLALG
jgi:hypothetical protein